MINDIFREDADQSQVKRVLSALDKQTPRHPIQDGDTTICPCCRWNQLGKFIRSVDYYFPADIYYCPVCGQAIYD